MSVLNRNRNSSHQPAATAPPQSRTTEPGRPASRTRASAAWAGACLAVAVLAVLIVFMLQNTASVEVSFLWMDGNLPLAIALVIAGVGTSLLTIVVGAARITQLRRRLRVRQ